MKAGKTSPDCKINWENHLKYSEVKNTDFFMVSCLNLLKTVSLKIICSVPQLIGNLIFIHIPTTSKLYFSSQYMELEVMKTCWRGSILVWNYQLVLFMFKIATIQNQITLLLAINWDSVKKKCIGWNCNWGMGHTCFASTIYEKEHKKINYQNFISVTNYHNHN